ncbi:MAG: Serine/threonine protein kinase [Chthoniobacteraceae bacterium]|nr:Serine/threonine protein kinase [Chthoniobacteraceae bacterium]
MLCPSCGVEVIVRRSFNHFETLEVLGAGGMGTVYRALDPNLNRTVAIKLLRKEYTSNPEFVRQFKTEAAVTASINHPNVVKVYSAGTDHGMLYIAMELADKGSLDELMIREGNVSEAQVLDVGIQIAHGLNAALQRGLIHRDIKPGNILFSNAHTAKIVDFGLAALINEAGTVGGEIWGTPYYVAPEKLDNKPEDVRSDIYSLGATLFHALAGRPPFEAETASMSALIKIKAQPINLEGFVPDVSGPTAFILNKTLQCDPNRRPQNYEELIRQLEFARTQLRKNTILVTPDDPRVAPLKTAAPKPASTGWITFATIATVVACGLLLYLFKPGFFQTTPHQPQIEAIKPAPPTVEDQFKAARVELVAGHYGKAAADLRFLDEEKSLPQPLHNWITLHQGLAEWLGGKETDGLNTFGKIEDRGGFPGDESELKVSRFFLDLAHLLRTPGAAPAGVTDSFDPSTYQAIGFLLAGLKEWNANRFEQAADSFKQFTVATPQAPVLWLGDETALGYLKKIAADHLADFQEFKTATESLNAAVTPSEKKRAIDDARAVRSHFKLNGKLAKSLDATIRELEPQVTALLEKEAEEQAARVIQQEAEDLKTLTELRQKHAALLTQYRFADAKALLGAAKLGGEKARRERDTLAAKSDWLLKFKAALVRDLNTVGYPAPITRKTGIALSGGVAKADDQQLQIRTQYGFVPVAWADVSFECTYAMAQSLIRPTLGPELAADRKWLLGVFALSTGKPTEGRLLLTEASQIRPEYMAALPLFAEEP